MPTPAPPLPRHLQVEVTGACNLRCRMCLVRYAPEVGRREGALSFERFLELVDALPGLRRLTLQGLGEPLLSPHLVDMVRHAAARGIEVDFNTNGVLMHRAIARDLVAAGLGSLRVSLDGATSETYEDVRHGTRFAPRPGQLGRVVANLRGLIAEREAAGSPRPHVGVVFVAMRRNVDELPALVRLAAGVGVDDVRVQNLSHTFSDTDPAGEYAVIRHYAETEALFNDARAAAGARRAFAEARREGERLGLPVRLPAVDEGATGGGGGGREVGEPGCTWPWDGAYVTHRGEVQPCCMVMGSDRATLGRLDEAGFGDIWAGSAYREFRRGLVEGPPPEVCGGCSMYRGVF